MGEEAAYDAVDVAIKNFVRRMKNINEMIKERERDFDGIHCIFCGAEIRPRERVTQCGKSYCKVCADRLFRF